MIQTETAMCNMGHRLQRAKLVWPRKPPTTGSKWPTPLVPSPTPHPKKKFKPASVKLCLHSHAANIKNAKKHDISTLT